MDAAETSRSSFMRFNMACAGAFRLAGSEERSNGRESSMWLAVSCCSTLLLPAKGRNTNSWNDSSPASGDDANASTSDGVTLSDKDERISDKDLNVQLQLLSSGRVI